MFNQEEGLPLPSPTIDLLDLEEEMDIEKLRARPMKSRNPESPHLSPIPFSGSNEPTLVTYHTANMAHMTGNPHYLI